MKKNAFVLLSMVLSVVFIFGFIFSLPNRGEAGGSEPYKIGLSGAVTGGAAGSYTPLSDGFRLYLAGLNEKGGIRGQKVEVIFEDNAGVGIKAGANIKRFAGEKVHLIVISGPSGIYVPVFEEAKRANIPVIVLGIGPHETVPPNNEPLVYGQVWGNAPANAKMIAQIMKEQFAPKYKVPIWGIAGIDIPVSRKGAEGQGAMGEKFGIKTMVKIAPLGTMDYAPIATAMKDAQCNIVSTWGPAGLTLGLFKSLQKIGYNGTLYINTPDPPENFTELMKEQPSIVYSCCYIIPLWVDNPISKEIKTVAEKGGVKPNSGLTLGWWYGKLVEEVFKKVDGPVKTEKLLSILNKLDLDFGGDLPPIKFTHDDHQGPIYLNGWSWSSEEKKFVIALPWYVSNASGTEIKVFPKSLKFPKVKE